MMQTQPLQFDELGDLLTSLNDGELSPTQFDRLQKVLLEDAAAQTYFRRYMRLCALLEFEQAAAESGEPGELENATLPPLDLQLPTTHYPLPTNFVGGPVFSYMVATVVLCLMLLGAWAYKINHDRDLTADNSRRSTTSGPLEQTELVFVGSITGMKDCQWSNPDTQTVVGAAVSLDREYALASGLLEITYKTGAKVILEGPCTYKVESSAGGYLERGKLTANIRGQKPEARGQNSEHYPLSTTHYPLFSIKTPTAVITDLGTEFGVEVVGNGETTAYVFQGSVQVQAMDGDVTHLGANEAARVVNGSKTSKARIVTGDDVGEMPAFVRRLQEPLKTIDLLDIVAGGNGTGRRRERGIDPSSGVYDPQFVWAIRDADRRYHAVRWHSFIDGVFVPDGRDGAVVIDSSEHLFDGFPTTSGQGYGSIWARGAEVEREWTEKSTGPWVYIIGRAERFQPANRGLLCLSPNAGITFDLEAIRRAYRDVSPNRFRAVAGLIDNINFVPTADGLADLWIFIDGTLKLKRTQLRPDHGKVLVNVEISSDARYLTLVSTDGGNGYANDYVVFGDPVLEMAPTD